jgi:TonB family protein
VLTPDASAQNGETVSALRSALSPKVTVLDEMLAASAFGAVPPEHPFNQTTDEAKKLGAAIGCDVMVLIRTATLRRSSSERNEFYEAYAAVFTVSSRSGRLISFDLLKREATKPQAATDLLTRDVQILAVSLTDKIKDAIKSEISEPSRSQMEEPPEPGTPAAKGFRAPIPYSRIKPEYTADAAYYDITATVDLEVDLRSDGSIAAARILRWGGYGLDESVEKAVRAMNWRPAERGARTLPMRFLLRYNFKRVDKEP